MRKLSMDELDRKDPELVKTSPKIPVIVVLDNVRSGLNVGSAFRTCDAFSIGHLHLCGITTCPPHREVLKTAIGATESVEWTHWEHTADALVYLRSLGYDVWGVEQTTHSIGLNNWVTDHGKKYAFVFGNEVDGIADEILPLLDGAIEIPQFGTKHSLNISVCAGVVLWEALRQMKW